MLPRFSGSPPSAKALVFNSMKSFHSSKASCFVARRLAESCHFLARAARVHVAKFERDVNSFEMFIMFYDFNSFPAPVKLPSYLLEYERIQENFSDEVINVFAKVFKVFQLLPCQKETFTLDAENVSSA